MRTSLKKYGYVKGISLRGLTGPQKKQIRSIAPGHSRDYIRQMVVAMRRGASYSTATQVARLNCIV